jgi:hypothetical protein
MNTDEGIAEPKPNVGLAIGIASASEYKTREKRTAKIWHTRALNIVKKSGFR